MAYTCIWLHGLGASGEDMRGITLALPIKPLQHIFLEAPMRPVTINQGAVMPAWYDILGQQLNDKEDKAGIEASCQIIQGTIQQLEREGCPLHQILLAGFSQGAAMALYTALHQPKHLGGVIALSGYLPLSNEIKPVLEKTTPFFIGYGRYDNIVMPAWSQMTVTWLKQKGYSALKVEDYPCEHNVCPEEIISLSKWMREVIHLGS